MAEDPRDWSDDELFLRASEVTAWLGMKPIGGRENPAYTAVRELAVRYRIACNAGHGRPSRKAAKPSPSA